MLANRVIEAQGLNVNFVKCRDIWCWEAKNFPSFVRRRLIKKYRRHGQEIWEWHEHDSYHIRFR